MVRKYGLQVVEFLPDQKQVMEHKYGLLAVEFLLDQKWVKEQLLEMSRLGYYQVRRLDRQYYLVPGNLARSRLVLEQM
jgi:hypothetical protein